MYSVDRPDETSRATFYPSIWCSVALENDLECFSMLYSPTCTDRGQSIIAKTPLLTARGSHVVQDTRIECVKILVLRNGFRPACASPTQVPKNDLLQDDCLARPLTRFDSGCLVGLMQCISIPPICSRRSLGVSCSSHQLRSMAFPYIQLDQHRLEALPANPSSI